MKYKDLEQIFEWTSKGNIGVSSNTMLFAITGKSVYGKSRDIPGDWADFNRCMELVNTVEIVKSNLQKVAEVYPKWKPIIREWDVLVKLWEKGDGFYEFLDSLRDECYKCDEYAIKGKK
mgnify:CR=1 FL=1